MIDKVLIAEDHEVTNLSLQKTMEDLQVKTIEHVYYCDDALNRVKLALQKQEPFDLLITDLYFEDDGSQQKIAGGIDLIKAVRELQPAIRILIFSAETRPGTIDMLFKSYHIDAYVRKARNDARELRNAMDALIKNQSWYPHSLVNSIRRANTYEFTEFDINIIKLLSQGYQQNEIPAWLQQHNIRPHSLSSIEKRLKQIRDELEFSKNEQIVLFCKETGLL